MMKKNIVVFLMSVCTLASEASWKEGYYTSITGGYSRLNSKLKTSTAAQINGQNRGTIAGNDASKSSFEAGVALGHRASFGRRHFSAELGVAYSNTKAKAGTLTAVGNHAALGLTNGQTYAIDYTPRIGISGAIKAGYLLRPDFLGYLKFGVMHNFGQYILRGAQNTKIGTNVMHVVPGFGFEGQINEKLYWITGLDYKLAISSSKKNQGISFTKRPRELVAKAGLGFSW